MKRRTAQEARDFLAQWLLGRAFTDLVGWYWCFFQTSNIETVASWNGWTVYYTKRLKRALFESPALREIWLEAWRRF